MALTPQQILLVAAKSMTDPRTVKKIYDRGSVRALARERIAEAAKALGLPAPPRER